MVLGVDVGGTFTDAVLLTPDAVVTGKAPTTPDDQSDGVMAAVEQALERAGVGAGDIERLVHGMTVGTNALLEGRTERTALVATEGFTDLEELGRQARPDLYRLCQAHPEPLVPAELRVAAPERCGPEGVLRPLDREELQRRLEELEGQVGAVAVCLLWGFRHPEHERAAAEAIEAALPGAHVSTSHETAGVFREYERLATTVVDAALSPLLARYLARLSERTSAGGLPRAGGHALERRRGRRLHGGGARFVDGALGTGRRRGGGGARGQASGWRRRGGPGHGRHLLRRVAGSGRPGGGHGRPRGRRAVAGAAHGGRAHRGRGRRKHRVGATPAARCAWAPAAPVPTPGPRATGAAAGGPP